MPQISRRKLRKDVEDRVAETLLEALSQVRDKKEASLFISDLLTPTERIMVSKRLAIAVLLLKGLSYESVKEILKVSSDTVGRVSLILKLNNGYRTVVDKLARTEGGREFWRDVAKLAHRFAIARDTFVEDEVLDSKLGFRKKTLI